MERALPFLGCKVPVPVDEGSEVRGTVPRQTSCFNLFIIFFDTGEEATEAVGLIADCDCL